MGSSYGSPWVFGYPRFPTQQKWNPSMKQPGLWDDEISMFLVLVSSLSLDLRNHAANCAANAHVFLTISYYLFVILALHPTDCSRLLPFCATHLDWYSMFRACSLLTDCSNASDYVSYRVWMVLPPGYVLFGLVVLSTSIFFFMISFIFTLFSVSLSITS